jgi:hypothetical protein
MVNKIIQLILAALLCAAPLRAATVVETGQFAASVVTGTTTVVTLAQGSCIILWTTGQTATGSDSAANAMWSMGFSDSTNHRSTAWASDDNVGTTNVGRAARTNAALEILSDGTPTSVRTVTDVNFSALSFDVVWDGTPAAAYLVSYMMIGGSDITNCEVGTKGWTSGTGTQSLTGLSFQPNFVMLIHSQMGTGTATRAQGGIGFATSSTKEFTMAWGIDDAATMTSTIDAVSYTNQAAVLSALTEGAETVDFLADFTQFTADGFDVNVSNAPAATVSSAYLVIKGGQWDVGTTSFAAGTGANSVTGMAFQPKGLMLADSVTGSDATVTIDALIKIGAATSTSSETAVSAFQNDAVLNTDVARNTDSTNILVLATSNTNDVEFTSFNSDGWTVTATGSGFERTPNQIGWFAMADNAVAPSCAAGQSIALLGVGCR